MANNILAATEFGDFQTPELLAREVCQLLARRIAAPASIVEPTCGVGHFLLAALQQFPRATSAVGVDINPGYVKRLKSALRATSRQEKTRIHCKSFFDIDWAALLSELPEPILVIGNPPWVTNAQLGVLGSVNLPRKSNFQNLNGLAALTGKSNFDISEWMLIKLLEALDGRRATLAMLCKTAVARKALAHAWKTGVHLAGAEIRGIDAAEHFGAAVDACLLVCFLAPGSDCQDCAVYQQLDGAEPASLIGWRDGQLLADIQAYDRWKQLSWGRHSCLPARTADKNVCPTTAAVWRSGIKHDCSKVMELRKENDGYCNGLGELVQLEDTYLHPMLKSSELTAGRAQTPSRWMLVTQRTVNEETDEIRLRAPLTWKYLQAHAAALDRRASSIYRKRPRFSVFGVGDYSFSPWKVAISGFYKKLEFVVVGGFSGKPIVLDDTGYFLACDDENEAKRLAALLNSDAARGFFSAFIFWDAKRPITIDVLRKLELPRLAGVVIKRRDCKPSITFRDD